MGGRESYNYAIYDLLGRHLMKQKPEPTKYFFSSMAFRLNRHVPYDAFQIKRLWKKAIAETRAKKKPESINFYIHIPFCQSKCTYCAYPSTASFDTRLIDNYIARITDELAFYKSVFSQTTFNNLYIGGGSPSVLSVLQMERLLTPLFRDYSFAARGELNFECHPSSMNLEKMHLIRDFGFNRITFGVQSLDPKVLDYANRGHQTYTSVKTLIRGALKSNIDVNVDLMIGLYAQSIQSFMESFLKIIALQPTSISVYHLHPPAGYIAKYFKVTDAVFYARLRRKLDKVLKNTEAIAKRFGYLYPNIWYLYEGYSVTFIKLSSINKKQDDSNDFSSYYLDMPHSTFGIGHSSVSSIIGTARYNNVESIGERFTPRGKIYKGVTSCIEDDMRDYILAMFLKRHYVCQSNFKKIFQKDLIKTFANAFATLIKLKKVKVAGDTVHFLPRNPKEIFVCSLLFWDKQELMKKLITNRRA